MIIAGVQAFSGLVANRAAKFNAVEQADAGRAAGRAGPGTGAAADRPGHLDGRADGDVLIHEGEPAAQLYYLASGGADVHSRGNLVGRAVAGQLLGEATVLGEAAAIATVTLTSNHASGAPTAGRSTPI